MKDLAELKAQYAKLGDEIKRLEEEPQTEPRHGQSYRHIYFSNGQWAVDTDAWLDRSIDRARLKYNTAFWQGTPAEQEAEALRAILRCRYVLENRWKPKQWQEVWFWGTDGSIGSHTFNWDYKGMVRALHEGFYSPTREAAEKRRDEFMEAFLYVPEGVK